MHVLHVIPGLASETGGPADGVVQLSLALEREGVASTILATDQRGAAGSGPGLRAADTAPGADKCTIRMARVRRPLRLAFSPGLDEILLDELPRVDVVHIHSLFLYPQFAAARRARQLNRPYLVSFHGALEPALARRGRLRKAMTEWLWQRRMLEGAAAIHVTSELESRVTAHAARGVKRFVVANIVEPPDELPPPIELARLGLDPARPVVTFLGRIAAKKRIDILVDAVAHPALRETRAQLAVVGPDTENLRSALQRQADALGVRDDVRFVDMLTGDAKWAMLRASTVWALPSVGENFGIAVAEALAAGVPVVITPEVSLSEPVREARAGAVVPRDAATFAETLAGIIRDPAARAHMAERARTVALRFRPHVVGPQFVDVYEQIRREATGSRTSLARRPAPRS
jgi:glycosyltransferase involved in cell wall biosynthesis